MRRNEQGMITAFVVVFAVALIAVAGLVVDGGSMLAATRRANDEAEGAARAAAATALNPDRLRSGDVVELRAAEAQAAAASYTAGTGHNVESVTVAGDTVRVVVQFDQRLQILAIGGLATRSIRGQGQARAARGVINEGV